MTGIAARRARPPKAEPVGSEPQLALLAILGQGIVYLMSVLLARRLRIEDFDAYAVAAAAFMLMATVAPLGSEKYALRVLPVYLERADWARARGYLRFGLRRALQVSVLLAVLVVGCAAWPSADFADPMRRSVALAALGVPVGALVHLGLEVLTASGRKTAALAIFRIAVPATAAACLGLLLAMGLDLSATIAMACWGPAWLLGLALMIAVGRRSLAPALRRAEPIDESRFWRAESRPFFVYRLSVGLLGQSGLIAMAALQAPAASIGAFAAAAGTAGLASVLATATNRAYGRRLSILLERQDYAGVLRLRRERLRWLLPSLVLFLGICFVYGREVLELFRPEFGDEGAAALRILAVGAFVSVLLSLAPTYLKYKRRKKATYTTVAGAAVAQALLLLLLVPPLGATGAAAAYTTSICAMYGAFAWMARRELLQFQLASTAGGHTER